MNVKSSFFVLLASVLTLVALAAPVTQGDATRAAEAFVKNDAIGSAILDGRGIAGIQKRGDLWIVALQPSGHIIMSASDLAAPIVGFSENDFTEPDPESPAFSVLQAKNDYIRRLEESAGAERDAKWDALLTPKSSPKLLGAPSIDNPNTVIIKPFMTTSYNQWQPYNDFAPIYEADENSLPDGYHTYRGRCPCGCVATAAAQEFRHFRWPARIDRVDYFEHIFENRDVFPIRFNGHSPIDWNSLDDSYSYMNSYSDLRGTVQEAKRFPIARLILWADVLAKMEFDRDGSSANYGSIASSASDWYTPGTWVENPSDSRVLADLSNGVPLQVTIPGHAVVCHGWAADGDKTYMYLNYGWGGANDGYYDINDSKAPINAVYVKHYPRAKPQLNPIPKVCGTNITLNWHFPDFYTNKLSGFTVSAQTNFIRRTTFTDDFSNSDGSIANAQNYAYSSLNNFYIGQNSKYGNGRGNVLISEPLALKTYTFNKEFTLTETSELSFDLRSRNQSADCIFKIQASFDGKEWTDILTPSLAVCLGYDVDSGWETHSVVLSQHNGETARFRIYKDAAEGTWWQDSIILLDNFTVTDVLTKETISAASREVDATQRSCGIGNLVNGKDYTFTVTPKFKSTTIAPAEKSEPVSATINTSTALGMPEITKVETVAEGFYKGCGVGTNTFTVTCSDGVTELEALPSHLALVKDGDVTVKQLGGAKFKVCITPSGVPAANYRSRMILTLVATDSNGTKAYKDLSLRFDKDAEALPEGSGDDEPVVVTIDGQSGEESMTVAIPADWFETYWPGETDRSSLGTQDSDGDGIPNWQEFICGTDPTSADEKAVIECDMTFVNGGVVVTLPEDARTPAAGYTRKIKESDNLRTWDTIESGSKTQKHFFKVVIEKE